MAVLPQTSADTYISPVHLPMRFGEFVAIIASLMAVNSLASSAMLAALPDIGSALGAEINQRQSVLTVFFAGFGIGQFIIGPVSDRFGRRTVLLSGLLVYVVASLLCVVAPSFETLLAARLLQGLGSAAPRVITISVVRDCYSGRRMASVMSLAMMVLMTAPIIAPTLGQIVILFAPWQSIFVVLTAYGVIMATWTALRLPETLPVANRRPLALPQLLAATREFLTSRQTFGYTLAGGIAQGSLLAFLFSSQPVLGEFFGLAEYFTLAFSTVAVAMSSAAYLNSTLVGKLGMRLLSHAAAVAAVGMSVLLVVLARFNLLGIVSFTLMFCVINGLFVIISSNANALAMEPQGHIAGTASSLFGSITTLMSALIAHGVGHLYDGTARPLAWATLACGLIALGIIALTERGRLFRSGDTR